jgi:YD repeat-containing protein
MPTVTSTAITRIDYDALSRRLAVTFVTGKTYAYFGVPRGVYDDFLRASSMGAFFNEQIRDRYDFALLPPHRRPD